MSYGPPDRTLEETALSDALWVLGLENEQQHQLFVSNQRFFWADIWIPGARVDVEVDGRQHEINDRQRALDASRKFLLGEMDILVKRVSNREIHADISKVAESVIAFCNQRTYMTWRG
jgi:very-short-patch-repair endonuclease